MAAAVVFLASTANSNPIQLNKPYNTTDSQVQSAGESHGHSWNTTNYNHLEPRVARQRVTQWDAPGCGQGHHHIKEDKRGEVGNCFRCVDIDDRTQSFDFALGWAPSLNAYSRSCKELALPFDGRVEYPDLNNPMIGHAEFIIQTEIKGRGTCIDPAPNGGRKERIKAVSFMKCFGVVVKGGSWKV
ncbi:MAG: hypothetical protein LQ351_007100 [Letrouitia transgressa]|nr:MAG: hypothetical protein LQ351_007100 [Letrouitia transgressa]